MFMHTYLHFSLFWYWFVLLLFCVFLSLQVRLLGELFTTRHSFRTPSRSVIIQEFYSNIHGFDTSVPHFITRVRGTHIVATLDIVFEVLHIPRVVHPDYPSYNHLRTMSKDELLSLFYETPSSWGDRQNIPCLGFAIGPRFLNMVMTFILHPLSHYNSIIEPRAWFL